MAKAFKCDRCGALFEKGGVRINKDHRNVIPNLSDLVFLDLCESCEIQFDMFMTGSKIRLDIHLNPEEG